VPKGVYKRSAEEKERLTKQLSALDPSSLLGISHGGKAPRDSEEFKQLLRDCRNKYSRTAKGRYQHLKASAKNTHREVSITLVELEDIRLNPCHYCSGPLPICGHGLDRLDNTKGYTKENIAPCCRYCNQRKGRLEQLGFKFPRTVELMKELVR